MSESRKAELKSTLLHHSQIFWPSFVNFMSSEFSILTQLTSNRILSNDDETNRKTCTFAIFINGLKLFAAFSEFIPLSLMVESNFTPHLALWLATDEKFFIGVLQILNVLVNKLAGKVEEQISIWKPIMDRFSDFHTYAITLSKDIFRGSNYELLKSLSQFISEFGIKQICAKKSVLLDQKSITEFWNTILFLLASDSDYLSSTTIPFWLNAFKQEKLVKNQTFFSIIPQLIAYITNRLLQTTTIHSTGSGGKIFGFRNPNQERFFSLDFDNDDEEYNFFISCSKNRYLDILKGISRVKVKLLVQLIN